MKQFTKNCSQVSLLNLTTLLQKFSCQSKECLKNINLEKTLKQFVHRPPDPGGIYHPKSNTHSYSSHGIKADFFSLQKPIAAS